MKSETISPAVAASNEPVPCHLVALRAQGSRPPLFCLPGAGSDAIVFHGLAQAIGEDQPVYSIQAAGLDASESMAPGLTVERVAARFIEEIQAIQPRGPYALAGHCFGGLLAYEVARQLMAAGEEVALLGLIDTIVSDTLPTQTKITLRDKLLHHRRQVANLSVPQVGRYFIRKVTCYRDASESRRRLQQSFTHIEALHRRYKLQPYTGRLTLFMAADSYFNAHPARDPRLTWQRLGLGGFAMHTVAGDHATLLHAPFVRDLATKLRAVLTSEMQERPARPSSSVAVPPAPNAPAAKPRALVDGGVLRTDPERLKTLSSSLMAAAKLPGPRVTFIQAQGEPLRRSYAELLTEARKIASGLQEAGYRPGTKILFQLDLNQDFVPAFWGCVYGGYVPVPISLPPAYDQPHAAVAKLENAWQLLEHGPVLTREALAPQIQAFGEGRGFDGFRVLSVEQLRQHPPMAAPAPNAPDDVALILLTSGSTGAPKGVMLSHRNLLCHAAATAQQNNFTSDDVSLNWMPLDHVGGIVMFHLRDVFVACSQIHAPTEAVLQRPTLWLDWIDRYKATITWAPNFAYAVVLDQKDDLATGKWDLSSMRFILNGGEAVVSRTARRFLTELAQFGLSPSAMKPAWGMSETSSGLTHSHRFLLELTSDADPFVEVGGPIAGASLRILDKHGELAGEGEIGSLQVRGFSVTQGYYANPKANAESFTPDGWFKTGDLGMIRNGHLTLTGREKDIIIVNGVNFYSHEIESVVEAVPGVEVSFTAACAIRAPHENTDQLAIFFSTELTDAAAVRELVKRIRTHVSKDAGLQAEFVVPLPRALIPKTAIGKIQRAQLKRQFESGEFIAYLEAVSSDSANGLLHVAWRKAPLRALAVETKEVYVVFSDRGGIGARIVDRLRAEKHLCVTVTPGSEFSPQGSQSYQLPVENAQDYRRLFQELGKAGQRPTRLLHLWALDHDGRSVDDAGFAVAQAHGTESVLLLTQAIAGAATEGLTLRVATRGTQRVQAEDDCVATHAGLAGLIKTLPQEFPELRSSMVDLDPSGDVAASADALLAELKTTSDEAEIAWRSGTRLVPYLQNQPAPAASAPAFKTRGFYVLSGGLGGIGQVVATHLSSRYQAKLLLLGRSPASEATLAQIRAAGGEVLVAQVDVSERAAVQQAYQQAQRTFGQTVDGVLHLAGVYRENELNAETIDNWRTAQRAKVMGARILYDLACHQPGAFFLGFSSLIGYFGGFRQSNYAAANAYLAGLARQKMPAGGRICSLLWSYWQETGMNRGHDLDAAVQAKGYQVLSLPQALYRLDSAFNYGVRELLVGLNSSHRAVRRHLHPDEAGRLTAEAEAKSEGYVAPRTETERKLVQIWQQQMKLPRVGIRDNFFELGGRSLVAARIFAQLEKSFGRSLPLATFFKAPTIEQLAVIVEGDAGGAVSVCRIEALQPNGARPPFFCIPGGGSDIIVFRPVATLLGGEQPFYGLQAHGLDGVKTEAPILSCVELAGHFIKEIRAVQPEGPYQIGGHCFGALIAYEIGQQLRAQGQEVALLALFDPTAGRSFEIGPFRSFKSRFLYQIRKCAKMRLGEQVKFLLSRVHNLNRTFVVSHRLKHTIDRARSMHQGYELKPYPGKVSVFLARDSRHAVDPANDPRLVWNTLAQDGAETHFIEGDHHTMLHGPEVRDLADKLALCLLPEKPHAAAPAVDFSTVPSAPRSPALAR